jgi:hypothetical protein
LDSFLILFLGSLFLTPPTNYNNQFFPVEGKWKVDTLADFGEWLENGTAASSTFRDPWNLVHNAKTSQL